MCVCIAVSVYEASRGQLGLRTAGLGGEGNDGTVVQDGYSVV